MLYIVGTGAFAREVADIAIALKQEFLFVSKDKEEQNIYCGVGSIEQAFVPSGSNYVLGMGNPQLRKKIAQSLQNLNPVSLIHPSAIIGQDVHIELGTIITAGCILTNRIYIGEHCIVNLGCTIGHDCTVGRYSELSPGCHLNGFTTLGSCVSCGSGMVTVPHSNIGDNSIIGAGAVVKGNTPANVTAVGVPAKVIKSHDMFSSL